MAAKGSSFSLNLGTDANVLLFVLSFPATMEKVAISS
jgi:hypothetical protein